MNNFNTAERRWEDALLDRYMDQLAEAEAAADAIDARAAECLAGMGIADLSEAFEFSDLEAGAILKAIRQCDCTEIGSLVHAAALRWAREQAARDVARDLP